MALRWAPFPSALMPGYRIFDETTREHCQGRVAESRLQGFRRVRQEGGRLWVPCSDPPLYQFGNTGFIMGEARDILRVLAGTTGYSNDQEGIMFLHAVFKGDPYFPALHQGAQSTWAVFSSTAGWASQSPDRSPGCALAGGETHLNLWNTPRPLCPNAGIFCRGP